MPCQFAPTIFADFIATRIPPLRPAAFLACFARLVAIVGQIVGIGLVRLPLRLVVIILIHAALPRLAGLVLISALLAAATVLATLLTASPASRLGPVASWLLTSLLLRLTLLVLFVGSTIRHEMISSDGSITHEWQSSFEG
jgi:hypothetical protein